MFNAVFRYWLVNSTTSVYYYYLIQFVLFQLILADSDLIMTRTLNWQLSFSQYMCGKKNYIMNDYLWSDVVQTQMCELAHLVYVKAGENDPWQRKL